MADAGVAYIALSGGEPLVRNDIFEVIDHIREREMAFSIATNGTLLTEEKVRKLEKRNCQYIQVSIDGKPATHNEMRGSNMYQKTLEGLKNAVNSEITTGVAMTVTKDNYDELDYVIDEAEELGADILMHYNFIPTGRGEKIKNLDITPEMREKLLLKLMKKSKEKDITLLSTAPQFGRVSAKGDITSLTHFDTFGQSDMAEDVEFLAEFVGGCGAGRLYAALQPNGNITPCVFLPKTIGNIKKDNFTEIWQNNKFLNKIRSREEFSGECGECEFRNICGGCRARAYAYYKDVQERDPGCILNKTLGEETETKIPIKT